MDRCITALAILAICVSGALSIPQEADPINIAEYEYDNVLGPIDCEWGVWGPCGATCGEGRQQRTIEYEAVNGGENCTGPATRECTSAVPCPIDCKWSQWSPCSKTCGNGNQVRAVEIPAQHGGRKCTGPANKACNLKPCPTDCKWSQWGVCSTTCGNGYQDRKVEMQARYGGQSCYGNARRNCNVRRCPGSTTTMTTIVMIVTITLAIGTIVLVVNFYKCYKSNQNPISDVISERTRAQTNQTNHEINNADTTDGGSLARGLATMDQNEPINPLNEPPSYENAIKENPGLLSSFPPSYSESIEMKELQSNQ